MRKKEEKQKGQDRSTMLCSENHKKIANKHTPMEKKAVRNTILNTQYSISKRATRRDQSISGG